MTSGDQMMRIRDSEDRLRKQKITDQLAKGERLTHSDCSFLIEQAWGSLNRHRGAERAWRHKRLGELFVLDPNLPVVLHHDGMVPMVNYRPNPAGIGPSSLFTRPVSEFLEKFERVYEKRVWDTSAL
jgi:hypothetical protein